MSNGSVDIFGPLSRWIDKVLEVTNTYLDACLVSFEGLATSRLLFARLVVVGAHLRRTPRQVPLGGALREAPPTAGTLDEAGGDRFAAIGVGRWWWWLVHRLTSRRSYCAHEIFVLLTPVGFVGGRFRRRFLGGGRRRSLRPRRTLGHRLGLGRLQLHRAVVDLVQVLRPLLRRVEGFALLVFQLLTYRDVFVLGKLLKKKKKL